MPRLTRREEEVLRSIAEGKTTSKMAEELFVSTHTIETHRRNLMQKFNVSNSASLIKMASEYKLI
ncbi:response regulator transcription factor [Pedobacter sp. CAN_A7]|uniref:response regulator transcription factor n=1 Tax=Pedobacter sp. CAN_A7 TaxID=2787722 RepID=UPI0018CB7D68